MATTQQDKNGSADRLLVALTAGLSSLFLLQLILGFVLSTRYKPTIEEAHRSVEAMRADSLWNVLASFHYWGSAVLILVGLLSLVFMVLTGRYVAPYRRLWFGTLAIFGLSYIFQITGNLLPMDRHDVQTVAIEGGIAARMPVVGSFAKETMLQGSQFGQNTLAMWFKTHAWILAAVSVLVLIWLAPVLLKNLRKGALVGALAPTILGLILALAIPAPSGSMATKEDFTSFDTLVSWYTWPLHGLMNAAEGISPDLSWLGTALVPGLFTLFLVALPFIGNKLSKKVLGATFLVFLALFVGTPLAYGGKFAPIAGNQDPAEAPEQPVVKNEVPIDPKLVAEGKKVFESVGCMACHSIDGSKEQAGPDLTSMHKEQTDRDWYKRFIKNPKSVKPGSTMPPNPDLLDDQLSALADYLRNPR